MAYFWLTPPSRAVFILSVFPALLALLVRYAHVAIPVVSTYTLRDAVGCLFALTRGQHFSWVLGIAVATSPTTRNW